MLVREVKALAGKWVSENASQLPGFMGDFSAGPSPRHMMILSFRSVLTWI